jgi:hypothetical protein
MDTSFESKLKEALKSTENLKTPACLDDTTIGLYIDGKLSAPDEKKVETHISSCLYCLDRVSELRELLYYQEKWTPTPYRLISKLEKLYFEKKNPEKKTTPRVPTNTFADWIASFFTFFFRQWRYVVVCVVSVICTALLFNLNFISQKTEINSLQGVNRNAFITVRALGGSGDIIRNIQGVIIDSKGVIATNLSPLAGATSVQIVLRDGRTYQAKSIWKDDGKNLALIKVEGDGLPSIGTVDLKGVSVGEKAFVFAGFSDTNDSAVEAVISDFKAYEGRRSGGDVRYIQLATLSTRQTKGAVLDKEGRLIGLTMTEEKNINFAVPLKEASRLIKGQAPVAVSELKNAGYSSDALNYYFKGVLARNSQRQDDAVKYFNKAIELNPNLEGAHVELGFIYYKKRMFDLEKKAYEEALRINPNNTDTLFYFATNLETRGLYEEAIAVFEKIIALDPEDADAYYELGLAYLAKRQKAKAMDVYNVLQKLDPGLAGKLKSITVKQ